MILMTRCQKIRLQWLSSGKPGSAGQLSRSCRLSGWPIWTEIPCPLSRGSTAYPLWCFLPGDQRRGKGYWRQGTAQERKLSQPLSMHRRWMKSSALQKLLGRAVSDNELLKEAVEMMSGEKFNTRWAWYKKGTQSRGFQGAWFSTLKSWDHAPPERKLDWQEDKSQQDGLAESDQSILSDVMGVLKVFPSFGYRRISAVIAQRRRNLGKPPIP